MSDPTVKDSPSNGIDIGLSISGGGSYENLGSHTPVIQKNGNNGIPSLGPVANLDVVLDKVDQWKLQFGFRSQYSHKQFAFFEESDGSNQAPPDGAVTGLPGGVSIDDYVPDRSNDLSILRLGFGADVLTSGRALGIADIGVGGAIYIDANGASAPARVKTVIDETTGQKEWENKVGSQDLSPVGNFSGILQIPISRYFAIEGRGGVNLMRFETPGSSLFVIPSVQGNARINIPLGKNTNNKPEPIAEETPQAAATPAPAPEPVAEPTPPSHEPVAETVEQIQPEPAPEPVTHPTPEPEDAVADAEEHIIEPPPTPAPTTPEYKWGSYKDLLRSVNRDQIEDIIKTHLKDESKDYFKAVQSHADAKAELDALEKAIYNLPIKSSLSKASVAHEFALYAVSLGLTNDNDTYEDLQKRMMALNEKLEIEARSAQVATPPAQPTPAPVPQPTPEPTDAVADAAAIEHTAIEEPSIYKHTYDDFITFINKDRYDAVSKIIKKKLKENTKIYFETTNEQSRKRASVNISSDIRALPNVDTSDKLGIVVAYLDFSETSAEEYKELKEVMTALRKDLRKLKEEEEEAAAAAAAREAVEEPQPAAIETPTPTPVPTPVPTPTPAPEPKIEAPKVTYSGFIAYIKDKPYRETIGLQLKPAFDAYANPASKVLRQQYAMDIGQAVKSLTGFKLVETKINIAGDIFAYAGFQDPKDEILQTAMTSIINDLQSNRPAFEKAKSDATATLFRLNGKIAASTAREGFESRRTQKEYKFDDGKSDPVMVYLIAENFDKQRHVPAVLSEIQTKIDNISDKTTQAKLIKIYIDTMKAQDETEFSTLIAKLEEQYKTELKSLEHVVEPAPQPVPTPVPTPQPTPEPEITGFKDWDSYLASIQDDLKAHVDSKTKPDDKQRLADIFNDSKVKDVTVRFEIRSNKNIVSSSFDFLTNIGAVDVLNNNDEGYIIELVSQIMSTYIWPAGEPESKGKLEVEIAFKDLPKPVPKTDSSANMRVRSASELMAEAQSLEARLNTAGDNKKYLSDVANDAQELKNELTNHPQRNTLEIGAIRGIVSRVIQTATTKLNEEPKAEPEPEPVITPSTPENSTSNPSSAGTSSVDGSTLGSRVPNPIQNRRPTVDSQETALKDYKKEINNLIDIHFRLWANANNYTVPNGRFEMNLKIDYATGSITEVSFSQFGDVPRYEQSKLKESVGEKIISYSKTKPMPRWDGMPLSGVLNIEYTIIRR